MSLVAENPSLADAAQRSGRLCPGARLEALAAEGRLSTGRALILSLHAVRDAYGQRWGRRSGEVFDLLFSEARRLLDDGDEIVRVGEVEVLIVPTGEDPMVSRGVAVRLLTDVLNQLLGEARPSALVIRAASGLHNGQIVSRAFEPEELAVARIAADAVARARRPSGTEGIQVESLTTFDGRRLDLGFAVEPVFDLARSAIAGYRIDPLLSHRGSGEAVSAAERMGLLASDMERVDIATLDRALTRLDARRDAGAEPPSLIVSMSFLSASSQRARAKLMLRPGPLRQAVRDSVIWVLTDVPDGAPAGRLTEIAALLRPFGRAVFCETRLTGTAMKAARSAGIAGLVVRPHAADLSITDTALWLLQAGKLARRAAPALIAANLGSEELLPMAGAAGFTHATVRRGVVLLAA